MTLALALPSKNIQNKTWKKTKNMICTKEIRKEEDVYLTTIQNKAYTPKE